MDAHDKIMLVTGSTDGIGRQTAVDLARMGAHVIVHGRNPERASEALDFVRSTTGSKEVSAAYGDLGSMDEIRQMAEDLKRKVDRIDVLVNNAGVYKNERILSNDGIELTFAVNHLSYFFLTGLLFDLVLTAPGGRIVNVASQAHSSQLDFENLEGEKHYEAYDAYARSKLCNLLFTYKLASMLAGSTTTANVLHPGVISTKLLHAGWGSGGSRLSEGSKTSVYLSASPEVDGINGKYFVNRRLARSSTISYDLDTQDKLWKESERLTGFTFRL
jgi:NAD(P)-dependent dehydrogenase (short-subunit alcohol dehydrogenase family)